MFPPLFRRHPITVFSLSCAIAKCPPARSSFLLGLVALSLTLPSLAAAGEYDLFRNGEPIDSTVANGGHYRVKSAGTENTPTRAADRFTVGPLGASLAAYEFAGSAEQFATGVPPSSVLDYFNVNLYRADSVGNFPGGTHRTLVFPFPFRPSPSVLRLA